MSLSTLITNLISDDLMAASQQVSSFKAPTLTELKNNANLKALSKYIRGGISKMSKADIVSMTKNLSSYKQEKYIVNDREIIPDSEQIKIVKAPINYNIRVIAGAGTGKTTTIGCRIKYLLDTHTTPDKILVLTFNVEARKNLEKMIDRLMGFDIKIEIRTIDSFCFKIKQDFCNNITNNFIKKDAEDPAVDYSLSEFGVLGKKIMEQYGSEICSQYKFVFFDEFQDVNEEQFQILKTFVDHGCTLTVIGDDSQNIYQFRGSDNYYIINFDRIFQNSITYMITTNYRSTEKIINMANESIVNNKEKIYKTMRHNKKENGVIDLTIHESNIDIIDHIIDQIKYYTEKLTIPHEEIAILARNTFPLKSIETEFEKNKLPYVALISDQYSKDYKQLIQPGKIVLSSIHKAKGLEWKVVFIIGITDSYFPSHLNNGLKNMEEERRLFYVAITRAKQYLHFVGDLGEIPFSRFIGEIHSHVNIVRKTNNKDLKKISDNDLFIGDDENKNQDSYSVSEVIELLTGKKIEQLRKLKLIPNVKPETKQLFNDALHFTDEIKKNVFESDFGIYCDYYMTRQLLINNNQPIKDIYTERILFNLHLTTEEKNLYTKYDIKTCIEKKATPKNIDQNDIDSMKYLMNKIDYCIKHNNFDINNIQTLLSFGFNDYFYPELFMKKLREAYEIYKNKSKSSASIKNSIYYVSLCPKFNDNRRRLVYRDIQTLYKENSTDVIPRIDEYVELLKKDKILCKLTMNKMFRIGMNMVTLIGELDYINVTNGIIVDIKCCEGEFKIEWLIQLLLYYALFMCNPHCCSNYNDIEIKGVGVINIFTGKYYEIPIPDDYDCDGLLDFVQAMISDSLKGIREKEENHDAKNNKNQGIKNNKDQGIKNNKDQDIKNNKESGSKNTKDPTNKTNKESDNKNSKELANNNNKDLGTLDNKKLIDDSIDVLSLLTNKDTLDKITKENNDKNVDSEAEYETIKLDLNKKSGYVVFDVENNCVNLDIIQLAYIVYDDNNKEIKRVNRYVKDRFADNRTNQITGITTDQLRKSGVNFNVIMKEFLQDISKASFVCGHHVHTDISKIKSNLDKYRLAITNNNGENYDLFKNLSVYDTANMYRAVKGKGKSITLTNMHKELFGCTFEAAHDALVDVEHTAKCYVELNRLMKLNNINNKQDDDDTPVIPTQNTVKSDEKYILNKSLFSDAINSKQNDSQKSDKQKSNTEQVSSKKNDKTQTIKTKKKESATKQITKEASSKYLTKESSSKQFSRESSSKQVTKNPSAKKVTKESSSSKQLSKGKYDSIDEVDSEIKMSKKLF